ncbi:MAG TPA: Lpg1974 family pore-forming outer membrane protein [Gemmatales bacterium]|nr:Lpg1974 family pore-forming outer membrane protein [Gemmatales bacterium]HMP17364.1 Lpg1974 family pore-forming outer membrane protein [Gemmatales bacterium]
MRHRLGCWLVLIITSFAGLSLARAQYVLGSQGVVPGEDISALPPPLFEEVYQPSYFFNIDLGLVQPRLHQPGGNGTGNFNQSLDWTLSPRFEFGVLNRGWLNPYFGYRGIYSDATTFAYEPILDTSYGLFNSAELHALDFGVLSETFPLLAVIRAQWDLSMRLTVADFYNRADFDFILNEPSFFTTRIRQQFVGAGPRAGLRMDLPLQDTGLSLYAMTDAGLQWGGFRARTSIESVIDGDYGYDEEEQSKGGILWHTGAQLGLRYAPPQHCNRLSFTAGYLYEAWFSRDINLMGDSGTGRFDYHGPFFRIEWRY